MPGILPEQLALKVRRKLEEGVAYSAATKVPWQLSAKLRSVVESAGRMCERDGDLPIARELKGCLPSLRDNRTPTLDEIKTAIDRVSEVSSHASE